VSKAALFIRHKALPGKREHVRRVWDKHLRPQIADNPRHEAYYCCYDDHDFDVIVVFQLYTDQDAPKQVLELPEYAAYWAEVSPLLAGDSDFRSVSLQWAKTGAVKPSGGYVG